MGVRYILTAGIPYFDTDIAALSQSAMMTCTTPLGKVEDVRNNNDNMDKEIARHYKVAENSGTLISSL
jgi:hypothetical protein